jgi:hypothetical protein
MQLKVRYEPKTAELSVEGPNDQAAFYALIGMALATRVAEDVKAQLAAEEQLARNPPGLQLIQGAAAAEIARAAKRGL